MTAWAKMSSDERDHVMLAAGFLNEPGPIYVNPRSTNDREWMASMVERGLFTRAHCLTRKGKAEMKVLAKRIGQARE